MVLKLKMNSRSVELGSLRQGAVQCRWDSCIVPLYTASCRAPPRYAVAGKRYLQRYKWSLQVDVPQSQSERLGRQL